MSKQMTHKETLAELLQSVDKSVKNIKALRLLEVTQMATEEYERLLNLFIGDLSEHVASCKQALSDMEESVEEPECNCEQCQFMKGWDEAEREMTEELQEGNPVLEAIAEKLNQLLKLKDEK